jgi:histone arginine demethylase JMJD6
VRGKDLIRAGEADEPVDYFLHIVPRIRAREGMSARMIEFVQRAGETVFIPGGMWHAVLNLEDTVAVTQNFVSSTNFPLVWPAARDGRRGMARKWLTKLREARPDLYAQARSLNQESNWDGSAFAAAHKRRKIEKRKREAEREIRKSEKLQRKAQRTESEEEDSENSDSSSSSSSSSSSNSSSSSGSDTSLSSLSSVEREKRLRAQAQREKEEEAQSDSSSDGSDSDSNSTDEDSE